MKMEVSDRVEKKATVTITFTSEQGDSFTHVVALSEAEAYQIGTEWSIEIERTLVRESTWMKAYNFIVQNVSPGVEGREEMLSDLQEGFKP